MGIWSEMFGLDAFLSWPVLSVIIPSVLLAGGFALLALDWFPHNLLIAQLCFLLAAMLLSTKCIIHAIQTSGGLLGRVTFAVVLPAVTLLMTGAAILLIQRHKESIALTEFLSPVAELEERAAITPSTAGSARAEPHVQAPPARPTKGHFTKGRSLPKSPQPQTLAPESGIQLSLSIVDPTSPSIVVKNDTDSLAEGVTWELVAFRESDLTVFSYATQDLGYVKAHASTAPYSLSLPSRAKLPNGGKELAKGDALLGSLTLDCPRCTGETYLIRIDWKIGGWFWKIEDKAKIYQPKVMTDQGVRSYIDALNQPLRDVTKLPIQPQ